jgi:hypothetical protein
MGEGETEAVKFHNAEGVERSARGGRARALSVLGWRLRSGRCSAGRRGRGASGLLGRGQGSAVLARGPGRGRVCSAASIEQGVGPGQLLAARLGERHGEGAGWRERRGGAHASEKRGKGKWRVAAVGLGARGGAAGGLMGP